MINIIVYHTSAPANACNFFVSERNCDNELQLEVDRLKSKARKVGFHGEYIVKNGRTGEYLSGSF